MAERQSARMSKITNDGLTRSDSGCFIATHIWQQWSSRVKVYAAAQYNAKIIISMTIETE